MIGILTFIFLIFFVFFVRWFAKWCTEFVPDGPAKRYSFWGVIAACMFILLGDEVIGGIQFGYLCYAGPGLEVLVDDLEGRKVKTTSERTELNLTPIKITENLYTTYDVDTNEVVFKSVGYNGYGGWLAHWIHFNSFKDPFLFDGYCGLGREKRKLIELHNMTDVNYTNPVGQSLAELRIKN
ncbi:hypothetical protein BEL05_02070 [Shewanella colwelliana]|uniref:Uncharacterized protein n=1 Tax=Shewanella colwelliana TaxID=23 RepID=A0A1E5IWB5_SHECO|nr:hypothetical protein [Shewanella colwelliana]OEG74861.1 hypothetical protein BEL05_02070 [Shewanella colwelliana]